MKHVLLLNPPGKQKYFRDYYCTCVSKAKYYYHPVDLLYLSGRLSKHFNLSVIDAIAEGDSVERTLEKIHEYRPDHIIFLLSSPSYEEDVAFLSRIKKELPETELIGCGDVYRDLREKSFKLHGFLDVILTDFSTEDIVTYLHGQPDGSIIDNVIYKRGENIFAGPEKHSHGTFNQPLPRWDLFPLDKYIFPFSRKGKYMTMMSDFGCPYTCSFCPMSTINFKVREIDNVMDELRALVKLGIHELFFRDQTFGVNKPRTFELCKRIKEEGLDISWTCFSRVDVVNEELLTAMKGAGCHTIMYGIETSNEALLRDYKKNIVTKQMIEALDLTKKLGIRTVGTFIIGLPGETKETIENTISFSTQINLDYASFNIATPRFGTNFRRDLIEKDVVDTSIMQMDSAKSKPQFKNQNDLTNEEIFSLHRKAIKAFYLRPWHILKRMSQLRTPYEIKEHILEGIALIKG